MLPYSIGHEIILTREHNAALCTLEYFTSLPEDIRRFAILRAAQVCSRTWAQNHKPDRWIRLWNWLIRNDDFTKAAVEFYAYRTEGTACPELNNSGESGRIPGSSYLARLLSFSCQTFGQSASDMPFGMIQHMYFAEAESHGDCKVRNHIEAEIDDAIREIQAEQRARKEAV